jgi:heme/copper-type cytochrome/quinol oxidase subunit 2
MSETKIESKSTIAEKVMDQIHAGKVTMLPKAYFVSGAVLGGLGVIATTFSIVYLINVALFAAKHNGPGSNLRVEYMMAAFPLWIVPPMLILILIGISAVAKSNIFYKHRKALLLGLFISIVLGVFAVEFLGFSKLWEKRYPLRLRKLHKQNIRQQEHNRQKKLQNKWRLNN